MGFGEAVPWAHFLTDVASEYPVLKFTFYIGRDLIFQFDGKVADTSASIDDEWFGNGLCRARVHTGSASTAIILYRSIVLKVEIDDDFGEKEIAAGFTVQKQAVLAYPTQPAFF